jgi:hypothetical protein
MRTVRRVIACLIVAALCFLYAVPFTRAASTFAADLAVYRARNTKTYDAARELASFVTAERRFVRTVREHSIQFRAPLRTYKLTLDQTDDVVRRIVRDQHTSDGLLADIWELNSEEHTDAAWVLLKRGLAGQERFLVTVARAQSLMSRCKSLHIQLQQAGT